jgi:hypothetical protein
MTGLLPSTDIKETKVGQDYKTLPPQSLLKETEHSDASKFDLFDEKTDKER